LSESDVVVVVVVAPADDDDDDSANKSEGNEYEDDEVGVTKASVVFVDATTVRKVRTTRSNTFMMKIDMERVKIS
jgi:hypothetical protein